MSKKAEASLELNNRTPASTDKALGSLPLEERGKTRGFSSECEQRQHTKTEFSLAVPRSAINTHSLPLELYLPLEGKGSYIFVATK